MSSMQGTFRVAFMTLGIMTLLLGCSTPNDQATFNSDTGEHRANWLPAGHASAASSGTTTLGVVIPSTGLCNECHGADLGGGISGVSCSSCHIGGPTSVHPSIWMPIVLAHGPSVSSGATTTAQCANQYCHGTDLGGVADSGPACSTCHHWPWDGTGVVCGNCHGIPPAGTRYPNMAGSHGVHTAITGTELPTGCAACHNNSDGVTQSGHYSSAVNIAFLAAYNAQSGGAAFNFSSSTCSQVSCHGGQTTPSWFSGTIDVNTQCTTCHAYGTTQYNSFNSGEHNKHVNGEGIACTSCHDTTKLAAVHFNDLQTTAMTQAAATLGNQIQSYSGGSCNPRCHGNETW